MEVIFKVDFMEEQHWQMPEWWYRKKRPSTDEEYFENMSRVIFQAGLNWHVIDNKWSSIKKAFSGFNIGKVACYTDADVERLMRDPEVIRNKGKIKGIIQNAQNFKAVERQYGSFQRYLDSLDKSNNYENVVKDLVNKFRWLGSSTASTFLYTVGEKIKVWD